jgi:hypothetical protein
MQEVLGIKWDFLGQHIPRDKAEGVATGDVDPLQWKVCVYVCVCVCVCVSVCVIERERVLQWCHNCVTMVGIRILPCVTSTGRPDLQASTLEINCRRGII